MDRTWAFLNPDPNATQTYLLFWQIGLRYGDNITILDGQDNVITTYYSWNNGTNLWTPAVTGRIVKVRLVSDASDGDYGFCVSQIASQVPTPTPTPTRTPCPCYNHCSCNPHCICDYIHYWYPN